MNGQWMALRICHPWGEILINSTTMPRSLITTTSLGYHPKPLHMPQTTRTFFTLLAAVHSSRQEQWPCCPFSTAEVGVDIVC